MSFEPFTTDRDLGDEDDFQAILERRMDARIFMHLLLRTEKQFFARMDMIHELESVRAERPA